MESFFLSETIKYLYLLFDEENPLNRDASRYIFSTQGHIFPLHQRLRRSFPQSETKTTDLGRTSATTTNFTRLPPSCRHVPDERKHFLPLKNQYFAQLSYAIGID